MTESKHKTLIMPPWGVHRLTDMLGTKDVQAGLPDGTWVRSVPSPYWANMRERLRAAWWVLTGRAHAVVWPNPGELERALDR